MNGIANRLSETNVEPSIRDLRALYQSNSSQRVNTLLTETMLRLCVSSTQVMKGLIPAYAAVVAGAHFSAGGGAGAFVLERICSEYDERRKKLAAASNDDDNDELAKAEERLARELDNLVLILSYLYSFGVVACNVIYDLIRELVQAMGERDVELLLLLLRSAGHQLRADDPAALKDIVLLVQERATQVEAKSTFSGRVKHMLETINDLKNNKRRKAQVRVSGWVPMSDSSCFLICNCFSFSRLLQQLQDQERTARLKKLVQHARSSNRGALGGDTLHITLADLRATDEVSHMLCTTGQM